MIFRRREVWHPEQRRSNLFTKGGLVWYRGGSKDFFGSGVEVLGIKISAEITIALAITGNRGHQGLPRGDSYTLALHGPEPYSKHLIKEPCL